MRVLKVLWGLVVDDLWLASMTVGVLILAYIFSLTGLKSIDPYVIWVGLVVAIWVSVEHQLRLKRKESRN